MNKAKLKEKISSYSLVCGVIGLGYVGLPLAVEKAKAGYKTIGFDMQETKVNMVNAGINYIGDVAGDDLSMLVKSGKLSATMDFSFVKNLDFIAICVPTPLDSYQQPDIHYLKNGGEAIAKYLKKDSIVVLESTTYPGTTEGLLKPILEKGSGLKCGEDFYLGFSPERVDPGNLIYKIKNTPKVVGGIGKDATEIIADVYRHILKGDIHEVSSPAVAEMEKLLENTYRNVNIGLVNEMALLCKKMEISIWEVIDAAKTKPYGFQAFYPGAGVGGHCIPLDPFYLAWKAREFGFHTTMIETAAVINDRMPEYTVLRAGEILNRMKKALCGAKILILGVAYKQDIDDYRESPALKVIDEFEKRGSVLNYYDPYIPSCIHKEKQYMSLNELTPKIIMESDLVVITTAHTNVDYGIIQQNAKYIFDTKNAMKNIFPRDNIEVL